MDGLADKILEQCVKTGENRLVSLSKVQCHWLYQEFCWCADHPCPIAGGMPERRPGATYAKWTQSINKYLELIEDELAFPSSTPPPSEEEWKKCSEQHIFICTVCDKELESRHIRVSLELSTEQRKWLRRILEVEVKSQSEYNRSLLQGNTNMNTRFVLKLMNNAIRILSTTPKNNAILFDLYTLAILFEMFRDCREKEPEILRAINNDLKGSSRRQALENVNEDLEMVSIFLEMNNEVYYDQVEKPLCHQCISNRESMKGV